MVHIPLLVSFLVPRIEPRALVVTTASHTGTSGQPAPAQAPLVEIGINEWTLEYILVSDFAVCLPEACQEFFAA